MTVNRRWLIKAGVSVAGISAAGFAASRQQPSPAASGAKRLVLKNLHTPESLDVEYFRDGAYVPQAMATIQVLLRDYRNGEQHPIDPPLLDYLHEVASRMRVEPVFSVISGYRSPETNAMLHERSSGVAKHSMHVEGRAIDVRLAGVDCADLAGTALNVGRGGVGYYRKSDFVHLDTGAFRTWRG